LTAGAGAATFAAAAPIASAAETWGQSSISHQLGEHFESLPGDKSIKIYAPATRGRNQILFQLNSNKMLFVASAIKTFVLCEALRQVDRPDIVEVLGQKELALNDTVWSLGSPTFNPPDLNGLVSERTTLEAMITRSDNTATDMLFKLVGADNVRDFIAKAGLKHTKVPDSTRALAAYLFGAKNYLDITWDELLKVLQGDMVHPFLNDEETLASSADDFVSYYSRALQGEFFKHSETLNEYRRILTLCDFIYLVPFPLGMSSYTKSGNADFPGFHARAIAGGILVNDRWAYFAFILNWYTNDLNDPETVNAYFAAVNGALTRVRDYLAD
jgi:beta-lactamase class A